MSQSPESTATEGAERSEDSGSHAAAVPPAPLTCRQALAALLHELSLNESRAYPSSSLKAATRDAYRALGEVSP